MKAKSLFQLALTEEIMDIVNNETMEVKESQNMYGDDDGNLFFPLSSDEILDNNDYLFKGENNEDCFPTESSRSFKKLEDDLLSTKVKTIKYDLSKNFDIISFLENLYKVPDIYGVLIKCDKRKDYLINPLHPLTALAIKLGQINIPKTGSIIIYNYNDRIIEKHQDFLTEEKGYDKQFEQAWASYIKQSRYFITHQKVKNNWVDNKEAYFQELENYSKLYLIKEFNVLKFKSQSVTDTYPECMLVPLQLLVSNIAYPYYGMVIINDPTGVKDKLWGVNTGIMCSGNINHKVKKSTYTPKKSDVFGSVCTGNLSNISPNGWLTLNRVYLQSMWFDGIMANDNRLLLRMATTAKKIACSFYKIKN